MHTPPERPRKEILASFSFCRAKGVVRAPQRAQCFSLPGLRQNRGSPEKEVRDEPAFNRRVSTDTLSVYLTSAHGNTGGNFLGYRKDLRFCRLRPGKLLRPKHLISKRN